MNDLKQAAQQALDALEGWRNYGNWVWPESALDQATRNTTEAITALKAALAAPQPEPVAYYDSQKEKIIWARRTRYSEPLVTDLPILPLYLHPPQRQPLTDEEINAHGALAVADDGSLTVRDFVRAIEKAHGIGGDK